MIQKYLFLFCLIFLFLIGCANPLNKVTYYRYLNDGAHAERNGADGIAEESYSRALVNVYIGNLGPEREAEALFNLGRLERINGKLDDSLKHLIKSLEIDEITNKAGEDLLNGTLSEIAKTYYVKGMYFEGERYLSRISKIDNDYYSTDQANTFLKYLFSDYAKKLKELGMSEKANLYKKMAAME